VCRTGASGSPVTMPLQLHRALMTIISVKVLTEIPPAQALSVRLWAIGVVSRRFRAQVDCLVDEGMDRKRLEQKRC
jgi:hypothetical protein